MSISIPFDMRDMEIDNLDTIPKKFGLKTAIIISIALYIISIFIQYSLTQSLIILLSMIIIGVYALLKSVKYYSNIFYLALLELLVAINTILLLANEAFK
jgi:4-hydroxybenzoate polyprenyltransferase